MRRPQASRPDGFTLIEALITVAILAILIAVAAPSLNEWLLIQRVRATAAELVTDIHFARAESIRRNAAVKVVFQSTGTETCYTVHTTGLGATCKCSKGAGNTCLTIAGLPRYGYDELKTVSILGSSRVSLTPNLNLQLDPPRALPNNLDELEVAVDGGGGGSRQLKVLTNKSGRPQICVPSGSKIGGYSPCT